MPLTIQQKQRLRNSLRSLYRSSDFLTIRQFIIGESSQDNPDYGEIKDEILTAIGEQINEQIKYAQERRQRRETQALPI